MKITEKELKDLIKEVILESHTKADEKTLKKMSKKLRGSSKLHAKQADELEDIVDRSDDDELEEIKKIVQEEIQADLDEAKKKKKKKSAKDRMKCNSPRRIRKGEAGHGTKKFVVKACKDGKEKIIRYGDANLEIKKDSPKRRKSFRARHKCDTAKDKMSARYWSCKKW
jgi:hypothetical protein